LVFSFEHRCQGERGSQNLTGMPLLAVKRAWWSISMPWPQVSERRNCGGREVQQQHVPAGALDQRADV